MSERRPGHFEAVLTGDDFKRQELRAAKKIINDEKKRLNREAAELIAGQARRDVPVLSGRLARSIKTAGQVTAGVVSAGGARVPYARAIHFGYAKRPDKAKGIRGGPIRPSPFLYGAVDLRAEEILLKWEKATAVWARQLSDG